MKMQHLIFLLMVGYLFFSCQPIYFTTPQPIDAKNIYEFPKEYQGLWVVENDSTIIGKNYFILKDYKQTHSISQKEMDTSTIYLLKNNKIFIKEKYADIGLSEGFNYKKQNDSIYFNSREITKIALSYETFLRKAGDYYILNTSNSTTWWTLYLIKKTSENKLEVYILKESDLKNSTPFDMIYNYKEGVFLEAQWRKKELIDFIQNGGFSEMILVLDLKVKKPLPK